MKRKVRKYDRLKNAIKGAKASYTKRLRQGDMMVRNMSQEEYVDLYMRQKEYKEYVKYRKSVSRGILQKEMSYDEFMQNYDKLESLGEEKFGFGKRLAKDQVIITKSKRELIEREKGWNLKNIKDNYQLHDVITQLIDDGYLKSEEVEDVLY